MDYSSGETDYGMPEMNIKLNNFIYFPGEIIKGNISLTSGNFLEKGEIIYSIYGEEKIKELNNIECIHLINIYYSSLQYPGLINYSLIKGIQIPFEINLPSYVIPSFEYSLYSNNRQDRYGYIKYYLKIEIPELDLICKQFIVIRKAITKLNSPLKFENEKDEKYFGLFKKVRPLLIVSYDKNHYYFNEEIGLKICFNNNNSIFNIKYIEIKLIRNIIFKLEDNYKDKKMKNIIYNDELFYEKIYMYMKMDSNDKNKEIILNEKIKLEEPECIFNKYNIDYLNLGLRDKSKLIFFLPSLDSTLFRCEYLIKIEGIYDSTLPIQNILINMPISVYHNSDEIKKENNDFNILNSHLNLKERGNNNADGLFPQPNLNIQNKDNNENMNNILINNNRNEDENEKEKEKEVNTFRND